MTKMKRMFKIRGSMLVRMTKKKDEEDTDEPGDNNDEDDGDGKNVKLVGTGMTSMKIEMKRVKMMKVMMNDENNDK